MKMVSSNIMIEQQTNMYSGTWTPTGNNKYLVSYLPVGVSGAQIVREYTLVPSHEEPGYPGVVIATHIESNFETDQIQLGTFNTIENMFYPEQAKID